MELQYRALDSGIRVIKLTGKLDAAGTRDIESVFAEHCSGDHAWVVVDLADVEFVTSAGIRLLTLTAKSITQRGGQIILVKPVPGVQHILDLTGIPEIIPIYSSIESAEAVLLAG